jgi:hypothetical protein
MNRYLKMESSRDLAPNTIYFRQEPVRKAEMMADVVVPVSRCAISGILTALATVGINGLFGLSIPPWLGFSTGTTISAIQWLKYIDKSNELLWKTEQITGVDLNHDGVTGRPSHNNHSTQMTKVEVSDVEKRHFRYYNIPLDDLELQDLAHEIVNKCTKFSRRKLAHIIEPERYPDIIDPMLQAGFLRPDGNGVEITPSGRAFLKQHLTAPPQLNFSR